MPTLIIAFLVFIGGFLALPSFGCGEPGFMTSNISRARQVIIALRIFASEHEGAYPKDLEELVKSKCIERGELERLNQYRATRGAKPLKWTVILDLKDSDPYDLPLVVSPAPMRGGKCILGLNDCSVAVVSDKEINDAMERLRKFREQRDKGAPPSER